MNLICSSLMDVTDQGYLPIIFSDDVLRLDEFRKRLDECDGTTDVITYIHLYEQIHNTVLSLYGQAKHHMQIIPVAKYIQDMKDLKPMLKKKAAELLPVYFETTEKRLMAEGKMSELRELRSSSEYAYSSGFLRPKVSMLAMMERAEPLAKEFVDNVPWNITDSS